MIKNKTAISILRSYIKEEIGRSLKTMNNDPYSFEDYPEFDVNIYPSDMGTEYHVKIDCLFDDKLSSPLLVYSNEYEAKEAARNYVEKLRRNVYGKNIEL